MTHSTVTYACVKHGWALTPEAREEMRKHDELMADTSFEGALYGEQMADVGELMKQSMQDSLMERILPRMPLFLCS